MKSAGLQAGIADRLGSTLFVAALAHGVVILGITFTTDPLPETQTPPVLNVTLLVDTPATANDEPSELLAQRSQRGAGALDGADRPTRAPPADPLRAQRGDPAGADVEDGTPRDPARAPEQLVTRGPADTRVAVMPDTTLEPSIVPLKAANLMDLAAPRTLAAEIDAEAQLPQSNRQAPVASPSTSESAIAAYLVGWRQRVELIGTANFPERLLSTGRRFGRPTLEVAIGADGSLEDIVVRSSSGDTSVDQAALNILRLAAPFEPLPPEVRAQYAVLRFAYEWDFHSGADGIAR